MHGTRGYSCTFPRLLPELTHRSYKCDSRGSGSTTRLMRGIGGCAAGNIPRVRLNILCDRVGVYRYIFDEDVCYGPFLLSDGSFLHQVQHLESVDHLTEERRR